MICGLCIVGKVYMEAMIIAYGDGRNGKSTFWNVIYKVLGSYSGNISADALTVNCKRNVKPEMAGLKGKRMIIAAELQESMRLNTSVVKQLCSTAPYLLKRSSKHHSTLNLLIHLYSIPIIFQRLEPLTTILGED